MLVLLLSVVSGVCCDDDGDVGDEGVVGEDDGVDDIR